MLSWKRGCIIHTQYIYICICIYIYSILYIKYKWIQWGEVELGKEGVSLLRTAELENRYRSVQIAPGPTLSLSLPHCLLHASRSTKTHQFFPLHCFPLTAVSVDTIYNGPSKIGYFDLFKPLSR